MPEARTGRLPSRHLGGSRSPARLSPRTAGERPSSTADLAALLERRHQTIALRDRAPESYFRRQFRTRRPSVVCEMSAISRRFERDPIPYALETDWLVGAGGFEPLHFRIEIRQDSQPGRRDSNLCISKSSKRRNWTVSWSPQPYCIIRDAVVRLLPPTGQSVSNASHKL